MNFIVKFWRELALVGLFVSLMVAFNEVQQRDDTINQLNVDIAARDATAATDHKWVKAQADMVTSVINSQNDAIQRVIDALEVTSNDITSKVDVTRSDNAKKAEQLRSLIKDLPIATNCTILMENMIKNGQAVQW